MSRRVDAGKLFQTDGPWNAKLRGANCLTKNIYSSSEESYEYRTIIG